jgi:hypothetical protein
MGASKTADLSAAGISSRMGASKEVSSGGRRFDIARPRPDDEKRRSTGCAPTGGN